MRCWLRRLYAGKELIISLAQSSRSWSWDWTLQKESLYKTMLELLYLSIWHEFTDNIQAYSINYYYIHYKYITNTVLFSFFNCLQFLDFEGWEFFIIFGTPFIIFVWLPLPTEEFMLLHCFKHISSTTILPIVWVAEVW